MKYEVILSQHKECETSLWLNRPLLVWSGLKWSYLISNQYMSLSSDSWPTKIVVIAIIDFFSTSNRKLNWLHIFALQNLTSLYTEFKTKKEGRVQYKQLSIFQLLSKWKNKKIAQNTNYISI